MPTLPAARPARSPARPPDPKTAALAGGVSVLGTGSYAPERVLTNAEMEKIVDTTDEWITSRTGIKERRIAAEGEHTSDIAAAAGFAALQQAGIDAGDVDLILVATASPDMFFPRDGLPGPAQARRAQGRLHGHLGGVLRVPLRAGNGQEHGRHRRDPDRPGHRRGKAQRVAGLDGSEHLRALSATAAARACWGVGPRGGPDAAFCPRSWAATASTRKS